MNSWTIGRRLAVVFVAVQAVVLAGGALTYVRLGDIDTAAAALRSADADEAAAARSAVRDALEHMAKVVPQPAPPAQTTTAVTTTMARRRPMVHEFM